MIMRDNHEVEALCEECGNVVYWRWASGGVTPEMIAEAQDAEACHICEKDEEVTA